MPEVTESQLKNAFLRQRQSLPLTVKIEMSKRRIRIWYEAHSGRVYVAFSGGKDSTILLKLVRSIYPDVVAVFVDTGLEFEEVKAFVRTIENVIWVKPKYTFKQVIERWGHPVVSKEVSMALDRYRNTKSDVQKALRLHGGTNPATGRQQTKGVIPEQYKYLIDAPFKCSEYCCNALKKQPLAAFERESGLKAFVGTMATDSRLRKSEILKDGCNAFGAKRPTSRPLAFWTEDDIMRCMRVLPHSEIYDMGYTRTGCMFCMFGVQEEMRKTGTNRFQLMKQTHPRIWEKALPALGIDKVLDYMGVPYK